MISTGLIHSIADDYWAMRQLSDIYISVNTEQTFGIKKKIKILIAYMWLLTNFLFKYILMF